MSPFRLSIPALLSVLLITANASAATWIKLRRVKEQTVDTPVPVFVKVHGRMWGAKVVLYYHPASGSEWHHRTMQPMHRGFGALIPCEDVRSEAIVEFYVQVERHGRPIARSGSKKSPHAVAFVSSLKGAPPALPGQDPPEKCEQPTTVTLASSPSEEESASKSEPPGPRHHRRKTRRFWADLGVAQDVALIGGKDVCSVAGERKAFYCFRDDGKQYLGYPKPGDHDRISTGFALSATRLMAGLDYVLGRAAIGARVGFSVHGGSPTIQGGKSSLPVLVSARAEYWFAKHAYSTKGFALYVLAEAGMAEADARHRVIVVEDTTRTSVQNNPPIQGVDAWKRMGLGYAGIGLGGFIPTSDSGGLLIELQGRALFPASGFVVAPSAAYAVGF